MIRKLKTAAVALCAIAWNLAFFAFSAIADPTGWPPNVIPCR